MPHAATAETQRRALEIAYRRADLSLDDLWMGYFTLGGDAGLVEVEAYLAGLMALPGAQRDILAHAVNERLDDLTTRLRVPYGRVLRSPPPSSGLLTALIGLLEGMEGGPPERLIGVLDSAAALLGVDVTVYLVDYGQRSLIPLRTAAARPRTFIPGRPLPIESTLAGRAFQHVQIMAARDTDGRAQLWVPLLDGAERLGVLEVGLAGVDDPDDPNLRWECRWLSGLVGHLITASTSYGDALDAVRRLHPRSDSAELIWNLLPAMTATTDRFIVAGQFEPTDRVGGDAFDYALSEDHASVAIFDSTGHSMTSGLVTAAALSASRSVRRDGGGLSQQAAAIDQVVRTRFRDRGLYVTAVLTDLDLTSGRLRYVAAGHPAPLLVRDGRVVKALTGGRRPMLGVGAEDVGVAEEWLQPGDSLLLYTDGVPEARDDHGQFFGVDRLSDFLRRAMAAGFPAPETVRRLTAAVLDHQHGQLQDDATVVLSTWLSAEPGHGPSHPETQPWI
ncbi:PP2C family protein-serine/threonine phosphatase [Cellulomonas aerilata]|uniref:Phosphatase n=1 Tax=Cellulomonas aerilata TaxID=515326 RepID=A0A512DA18_9CELL|nr:PP2C family protein-serine/threonine phosphatase [Cellulomonas aerilata]GEO33090.1 phosphatase [Cellulomonas aerilata]